MRNRGFTLLEVMIALGLILALMTAALPAVLHRLPGTVWEETLTQLRAGVRHAAADCRRAGQPLELIAREEATGRWVLEARPLSVAAAGALDAEDARVLTPAELEEAARIQEALSVASGARVYMRLPRDYRVIRPSDEARVLLAELPAEGDLPGDAGREMSEEMDAGLAVVLEGEEAPAPDVMLAILMPDGSAITGDPVVLIGPGGRRAELGVRAWSSVLETSEGVTAPGPAEEPEDDAEMAGDAADEEPEAPLGTGLDERESRREAGKRPSERTSGRKGP